MLNERRYCRYSTTNIDVTWWYFERKLIVHYLTSSLSLLHLTNTGQYWHCTLYWPPASCLTSNMSPLPLDCTWDTWGTFTGKATKTAWARGRWRPHPPTFSWPGTITVTVSHTVMDTVSGNPDTQMEYAELGQWRISSNSKLNGLDGKRVWQWMRW